MGDYLYGLSDFNLLNVYELKVLFDNGGLRFYFGVIMIIADLCEVPY